MREKQIEAIIILINQTISKNIVKIINNKITEEEYEAIYKELIEYNLMLSSLNYNLLENIESKDHKTIVKNIFSRELIKILRD